MQRWRKSFPELPIGIQAFDTIRRAEMVYVDNTRHIAKMLSSYSRVFLCRPRRFGKSLLVSTLRSLFQGEEHIFRGLAIEGDIPVELGGTTKDDIQNVKISKIAPRCRTMKRASR